MMAGESLTGPEELSRIFPSYHPVLVADVKCEEEAERERVESFQGLKSWIHVHVVIEQTRAKRSSFGR